MEELKNIAQNIIKKILQKKVLLLVSIKGIVVIAIIGLLFLIIVTIVGINSESDVSDDKNTDIEMGEGSLSPHILKYKSTVEKYTKEEGIEEYTAYIMAMMQQESGGNPDENDPMQSSESKCGVIGCITDPDESIKQGVKYFKTVLEKSNNDILLAIASYNMGEGFIYYYYDEHNDDKEYSLNKVINGKKTSNEIIAFSQEQYKKNPSIYNCSRAEGGELEACHGDIMYVDSILHYAGGADNDGGIEVDGEETYPVPHTRNVTSGFNPTRKHPITGLITPHNGADITEGGDYGSDIVSYRSGKVVHAEYTGSAGNMVQVEHGNGMTSVYMHLSVISVQNGQEIEVGNKVGEMGNTGGVSPAPTDAEPHNGTHLHFEIRIDGNAVDPYKFLKDL